LFRCGGKTGLDVTVMQCCRKSRADNLRREAFGCIEPDARRLDLVGRQQQCRSLGRGLKRFGDDDRDRLVGVADAIVLQHVEPEHERISFCVRILSERRLVGRCHHVDHARMRLGSGDVEKRHAAARDAAHGEHCVEHAGRMIVGGITRGTGDFEKAIAAGERLAHI
jgi:hypothetical protein